jgi:cobaltochelatase CobT subunit
MLRRAPNSDATRVYSRDHDFTGSSAQIVGDPDFPPFASSVARRSEAGTKSEREGFSYSPGPRLLDANEIAGLPASVGRDDLTVAILVDQSGGLRGATSDRIVACVDRIALSLEAAGTPFEVLGFSTLRWKGGLSRERWVAEGRPESPGRLADLMHVIHKELGEGWTDGAPSPRERLDLMMRDPYMREGLDGEAVAWALDRLATMDAPERVLVVVGDATPIDDATIQVESRAFLEADLVRSVRRAAREGVRMEAVAVVADAAVAEFYPSTTYIPAAGEAMDPAEAAKAVCEALGLSAAPVPEAAPRP